MYKSKSKDDPNPFKVNDAFGENREAQQEERQDKYLLCRARKKHL